MRHYSEDVARLCPLYPAAEGGGRLYGLRGDFHGGGLVLCPSAAAAAAVDNDDEVDDEVDDDEVDDEVDDNEVDAAAAPAAQPQRCLVTARFRSPTVSWCKTTTPA